MTVFRPSDDPNTLQTPKKDLLLNSNDLAKLLHLCWEVERNHEFPTHYHRYDKNAQNGEKCDGEVEEGVPTLGL